MQPDRWGARSSGLPVGTLTFFRSDVESSMGLARALGARYDEANAAHHAIVREAITRNDGQVVRTAGDAVFAVFTETPTAARAAIEVQRAMATRDWPDGRAFKVRIGLHAGAARRAGDDYGGFEVSRAARIADLGWGGQTVLSDAVRVMLAEELDDEWSVRDLGRHRLKGIVEPERIFQLVATGLPSEFPPLRTGSTASDHLPERLTSMIGREWELDELGELLAETRLLTITGPGGIGKTTLAIELARRHADGYSDGAWFVDLQGIRDASDVPSEVAHDLGLLDGSAGPAADRLLAYVAERELLVVIDNFEQVIDAAGRIGELLMASPRSRLILTSRVPLRLSAEQEYLVRPLALATDGSEPSAAVRLFVERAWQVRHDLAADAELATVRDICILVDGLPLAIELAAARVSSLPIAAIHDRLAAHLPLPGSGPRDLPERQRTIEATVAWSHDLLEPPLQRMFTRLGVFEDSFEFEQVEAVCGPGLGIDVLEGLTALLEHSLVFRVDDAIGGIRYGMLETVRAFARARLAESGEAEVTKARHMTAFRALVERDWPMAASQEVGIIERIEPDEANVRAAVAHAIETEAVEIALRMVGFLWRPWLSLGRLADGRVLTDRALALPGSEARTRARIMALDAAGGAAYWSRDLATALACYEEQLEIAEGLDDPPAIGLAAVNLFFTRYFMDDTDGAETALALARRIAETHDMPAALARADLFQDVPLIRGVIQDPAAVRPKLVVAAERHEAWPDPVHQESALSIRALVSFVDGDLPALARNLASSMRVQLSLRDDADVALRLASFIAGICRLGRPDLAAIGLGAVDAAFERLGIIPPYDPYDPEEAFGSEDPTDALIEALGQDDYEAAFERGRRMSLADVTDYIEGAGERLPG